MTKSVTRLRLHSVEVGEKAPEQIRFLINLKVARMSEFLSNLEKGNGVRPTPKELVSAVHDLTEFCIRSRVVLWFGVTHCLFMDRLSKLAHSMVEDFDSKKTVILIWVYGKIAKHAFKQLKKDNYSRQLITALVQKLIDLSSCQHLSLHDVTLLVNGLANLDCISIPQVIDGCLPTISAHLQTMTDDNFSLIVWSLGKLDYRLIDPAFQSKFDKEVKKRLNQMNVQQLSSVAWALVRLELPLASTLLSHVVKSVQVKREEFIPLGIARLVDACYLMNLHPGEATLKYLAHRFANFRTVAVPHLCSQVLPAFAYFSEFPPIMFQYSLQAVRDRYSTLMDVDQMLRYLRAYSIADHLSPSYLELVISKVLKQDSYQDLPPVLLRDLWIGVITHRARLGDIVLRSVPKGLLECAKKAWESHEERKAISEDTGIEIQVVLKQLELVCSSPPFWDEEYSIRADLGTLWKKQRIVWFLLDDHHLFANAKQRLNGDYLWLERVFLRLGYGVCRLSVEKWKSIDNEVQRKGFLKKILNSRLVIDGEIRASKQTIDLVQTKYLLNN